MYGTFGALGRVIFLSARRKTYCSSATCQIYAESFKCLALSQASEDGELLI
jgi:hypothetical protein